MTGWRRGKCDCCGTEVCGDCSPCTNDADLADVTINHLASTQYAIACDCTTSHPCDCDDHTDPDKYEGFSTTIPGWSATARSAGGCGALDLDFGSIEMIYDCVDLDAFGDGHVLSLTSLF